MIRAVSNPAMALHAVRTGVQIHADGRMDIGHGVLMTAQAVAVHRLLPIRGQLDMRRIVPEHRMIGVHHTRASLFDHVDGHIVVRQMAFHTVLLLMRGLGKGRRLALHGMAGTAKSRRSGKGHHPGADTAHQEADGKSARQTA